MTCAYEEMAERAVDLVRSGDAVALGLETLSRFKAGPSMASNIAAAMTLPVFDRLKQLEQAPAP